MGMRVLTVIFVSFAIVSVAASGVLWWGKSRFDAIGPLISEHTEVIEKGTGLKAIARQLEGNGIIDDARVFEIGARLSDEDGPLRAGEFVFPAGASARTVLSIIRSGKTHLRRLTVAEGLTSTQIVERIKSLDGLRGEIHAPIPAEGSLLPETYYFSYGDERQDVLVRMEKEMASLLATLWLERASDLPLKTPQQALILASIVEKETGVADERAHIAGVFINRLRKGMRLQSDPTVSYGITLGKTPMDRPLTRADLKEKTPYNTYTIYGLPPGPIANPGRAAIKAVLHPAETDDLYFVADGTGGHAFAKTLEEHNRNVRKWRTLQQQNTVQ